ncbi:DUF4293 family protein [Blattabacterium cuenoti]|uniref:DUF4293 family protein n=1 Tax=Blattabacterium cuenoti TaxID=1653831 RepID=UPI00163BE65D|nr:DUF4293 family protein [Blattabacterium cuenoti]
MLYRIQTIYLVISIFISSLSFYFYPVFQNKKEIKYPFFVFDKAIFIFLIVCIALSICSFLSFQKRKLQILFNCINILLNSIIFIVILFVSFYQSNKSFLFLRKMNLFLTFLSIWIFYFSNKYIKKDIELINSINRIR